MTAGRSREDLVDLVRELCRLPAETEWVELKENDAEPDEIGEYISALANAAALNSRAPAFVVWGVRDTSHEIVGTTFTPGTRKIGNQELQNWLLYLLTPGVDFHFHEIEIDGRRVILLEIPSASSQPVQFKGQEFIRVGSYKKKLKDFPEKARALWRSFDHTPFEDRLAAENVPADEVLRLLDYQTYFELRKLPILEGSLALEALQADRLIWPNDTGRWDITNLGAVLFARRLADFRSVERKAMRVIQYRGNSRIETIREQVGSKGYANGFEGLIAYINRVLPSSEVIGQALRTTVPTYPEPAVRELVANTLIHQDFFVTGAGPMVEIFEGRVEITNPGEPLVRPERFLDKPPKSRNEALAALMRQFGICEERGSGIDKVVAQTELFQLPAPLFEVPEGSTRSVLFAPRPLTKMDKADRVRACYLHACLKFVNREYLTNSSLRERFGIEPRNKATASRLIREAITAGVLVAHDPSAVPKEMKYVPFWARSS